MRNKAGAPLYLLKLVEGKPRSRIIKSGADNRVREQIAVSGAPQKRLLQGLARRINNRFLRPVVHFDAHDQLSRLGSRCEAGTDGGQYQQDGAETAHPRTT